MASYCNFLVCFAKKKTHTLVVILAPPRANKYDGDFPQNLFDGIFFRIILKQKYILDKKMIKMISGPDKKNNGLFNTSGIFPNLTVIAQCLQLYNFQQKMRETHMETNESELPNSDNQIDTPSWSNFYNNLLYEERPIFYCCHVLNDPIKKTKRKKEKGISMFT